MRCGWKDAGTNKANGKVTRKNSVFVGVGMDSGVKKGFNGII